MAPSRPLPPVVYHPAYSAPMPPGHRFPMHKYARLAQVLEEERLVGPGGFHIPVPASFDMLAAVHDPGYVRQVLNAEVPPQVERIIGMPVTRGVSERAQAAVGGTLLAARLALRHGLACNTAGGSHHAGPNGGAGFCVFNDIGVVARAMIDAGEIRQALVVDLDVHQGDGTAFIFEHEPRVFTFSMHGEKNYPVRRGPGDLDIDLPDGTGDDAYLAELRAILPVLLQRVAPDLTFYIAGVDPHVSDRLGRLALSDEGLAARDAYVLETCLPATPVVGVIGGGYDDDIDRLAHRHAILHRAAADAWRSGRARPAAPRD
ncbi:histone deacetylase family protein [Brevundimonas goettingensis]|uniref:Histone deacetylase n=1 Tax=Brevundimonas goettingensis TaxID=2774190 RepID=A0A975C8Q7_9CAUL|nr:histone deacetylase [Brevundimonas goettingensis]QTC93201.1 histone deacetylase [Brevundimonas goettingensis]